MIKSQDELNPCNDGKRSSEVLIKTIEKLERTQKQLDMAVKCLRRYARGKHYRGMINLKVVDVGDWAKETLKKIGVRS